MTDFMRTILLLPLGWRIWIGMLLAANLVAPLFFLPRLEAFVVIVALILGFVSQTLIFGRLGFVRLLGLGHVWWIPLLGWLWTRVDVLQPPAAFGYWIAALFVLNGLSLVIDASDVTRYLLGDREPQLRLEPAADQA